MAVPVLRPLGAEGEKKKVCLFEGAKHNFGEKQKVTREQISSSIMDSKQDMQYFWTEQDCVEQEQRSEKKILFAARYQ